MGVAPPPQRGGELRRATGRSAPGTPAPAGPTAVGLSERLAHDGAPGSRLSPPLALAGGTGCALSIGLAATVRVPPRGCLSELQLRVGHGSLSENGAQGTRHCVWRGTGRDRDKAGRGEARSH